MSRYQLLISGIHDTNVFIVRLFIFALCVVIAYPVLGWMPDALRKPAQNVYLLSLLALFVTVLILGSGV